MLRFFLAPADHNWEEVSHQQLKTTINMIVSTPLFEIQPRLIAPTAYSNECGNQWQEVPRQGNYFEIFEAGFVGF